MLLDLNTHHKNNLRDVYLIINHSHQEKLILLFVVFVGLLIISKLNLNLNNISNSVKFLVLFLFVSFFYFLLFVLFGGQKLVFASQEDHISHMEMEINKMISDKESVLNQLNISKSDLENIYQNIKISNNQLQNVPIFSKPQVALFLFFIHDLHTPIENLTEKNAQFLNKIKQIIQVESKTPAKLIDQLEKKSLKPEDLKKISLEMHAMQIPININENSLSLYNSLNKIQKLSSNMLKKPAKNIIEAAQQTKNDFDLLEKIHLLMEQIHKKNINNDLFLSYVNLLHKEFPNQTHDFSEHIKAHAQKRINELSMISKFFNAFPHKENNQEFLEESIKTLKNFLEQIKKIPTHEYTQTIEEFEKIHKMILDPYVNAQKKLSKLFLNENFEKNIQSLKSLSEFYQNNLNNLNLRDLFNLKKERAAYLKELNTVLKTNFSTVLLLEELNDIKQYINNYNVNEILNYNKDDFVLFTSLLIKLKGQNFNETKNTVENLLELEENRNAIQNTYDNFNDLDTIVDIHKKTQQLKLETSLNKNLENINYINENKFLLELHHCSKEQKENLLNYLSIQADYYTEVLSSINNQADNPSNVNILKETIDILQFFNKKQINLSMEIDEINNQINENNALLNYAKEKNSFIQDLNIYLNSNEKELYMLTDIVDEHKESYWQLNKYLHEAGITLNQYLKNLQNLESLLPSMDFNPNADDLNTYIEDIVSKKNIRKYCNIISIFKNQLISSADFNNYLNEQKEKIQENLYTIKNRVDELIQCQKSNSKNIKKIIQESLAINKYIIKHSVNLNNVQDNLMFLNQNLINQNLEDYISNIKNKNHNSQESFFKLNNLFNNLIIQKQIKTQKELINLIDKNINAYEEIKNTINQLEIILGDSNLNTLLKTCQKYHEKISELLEISLKKVLSLLNIRSAFTHQKEVMDSLKEHKQNIKTLYINMSELPQIFTNSAKISYLNEMLLCYNFKTDLESFQILLPNFFSMIESLNNVFLNYDELSIEAFSNLSEEDILNLLQEV